MNFNSLTKLLLLLPFLCLAFTNLQAQSTKENKGEKVRPTAKFRTGDVDLKAGIGLLPTFINQESRVLTLPMQASLAYRLSPIFSVGAYAGYTSVMSAVKENRDGSSFQSQNDFLILGLRAQAHVIRFDNLDIYGGFMLAYNSPNVTTTQITERTAAHSGIDEGGLNPTPYNPNPKNNNVIAAGYIGGAYYFTENASVFGEIGYGVSLATVGLGYKF